MSFHTDVDWKAAAERAAVKCAFLYEFVQSLASEKICSDAPHDCYQDSGPYCGAHCFDQDQVERARAVLDALAEIK